MSAKGRQGIGIVLLLFFVFVVVYTYAPIILLIILSFNSNSNLSFPMAGFNIRWYNLLFSDAQMLGSVFESIKSSAVVMAITTALGVMTGLAFRRGVPGRSIIFYLILLGILVPAEIYGLSSAIFLSDMNVRPSFWAAVPVEVIYTLPFGLILILARFDREIALFEDAARTIGASEFVVFRKITFPLIIREIIATALFSFTLSFGELQRALFVVGSDLTLPVFTFGTISGGAMTPEFYALGSITTAVSFLLLGTGAFVLLKGSGRKFF